VRRVGNLVISVPISARIICAATGPTPGNGTQASHRGRELADLGVDAGLRGGDVGGDRIHPSG
jgi:hypothetical protein